MSNVRRGLGAIELAIVKFLVEHGGDPSGIETYVRGKIPDHHTKRLDWSTPKAQLLSLRDVREKGRELYSILEKIARSHYINKVNIEVDRIPGSEGDRYRTSIVYKIEREIRLKEVQATSQSSERGQVDK